MSAVSARPGRAAVVVDWETLAARAQRRRRLTDALLFGFLFLGSLPILVPYLWLVTVAFSGRPGASTEVLWLAFAILFPALFAWSVERLALPEGRPQRRGERLLLAATLAALALVLGPYLHLDNWRFLWNANIADRLQGASGLGVKFPSVWTAFRDSLLFANFQMILVVMISKLAGYYLL